VELSLGRRADYAIRATLDLANHHDGERRRKAREIGAAMDVPASYLPQILALLVRAGIASSAAGPRGGYGLARDPAGISLLDVVRAVDGDLGSKECVLRGGPCRWEDCCAVHEPWTRAQQALMAELAATTFADVVALDRALPATEADGAVVAEPVA
jgi:Rrf2 family protein